MLYRMPNILPNLTFDGVRTTFELKKKMNSKLPFKLIMAFLNPLSCFSALPITCYPPNYDE